MVKQTVVIGAGAAGVCSALLLARYGHKVTLLEAGSRIAPLLRGFHRRGLRFDTGFHQSGALEAGGILRRYLSFTGLARHLEYVPFRRDCCGVFRFPGSGKTQDFCMPQGLNAATATLSKQWPQHAPAIQAFYNRVEETFWHSAFIDPRHMSFERLVTPGTEKADSVLAAWGLPARLRALLTAHAIYYGTPPRQCLFDDLALVTRSMLEGVHGIRGGGEALCRAFEVELAAAGVNVVTNGTARSIKTEFPKLKSVILEGGNEIPCDCCVYTGHPTKLPEMLSPECLRPAMARHLRGLEETKSAFTVFGSIRSDFLSGRSMTLCLRENLDDAYDSSGPEDSWLHLSVGEAASDGRVPVCAVTGVAETWKSEHPGASDEVMRYDAWKARNTGAIVQCIAQYAPELGNFQLEASASGRSMAHWVHGSRGGLYGILHGAAQLPVLPFTRVEGLVLAGQNIILPGLLGACISAAVACGSIIGYKRLFRDLSCVKEKS